MLDFKTRYVLRVLPYEDRSSMGKLYFDLSDCNASVAFQEIIRLVVRTLSAVAARAPVPARGPHGRCREGSCYFSLSLYQRERAIACLNVHVSPWFNWFSTQFLQSFAGAAGIQHTAYGLRASFQVRSPIPSPSRVPRLPNPSPALQLIQTTTSNCYRRTCWRF